MEIKTIDDKKYSLLWDWLLPAAVAVVLVFQPYFYHGIIDFWETGLYLPFIEGVFNGKVAFKDMVLHRGPLEIYVPALLMAIFGKHINVLSAFYYFGNILTIVLCLWIARLLIRTRTFLYLLIPVLAAKTFPITFYQNWGGVRFGCGLAAILCALFYFKNQRQTLLFIAGLFSALGFFFSVEIGIFSSLAIILAILIGRNNAAAFKRILFYSAGCATVSIPVLAYLYFTGGMLTYLQVNLSVPFNSGSIYHFEVIYPDFPRSIFQALKYLLNPFDAHFRLILPLFLYLPLWLFMLKKYFDKQIKGDLSLFACLGLYGSFMYLGSFRQINGPQLQMAMQPTLVLFFVVLERYFLFFKKSQLKNKDNFSVKANGVIIFLVLFSLLFPALFTVKFYLVYGADLKRFTLHLITKGCFPAGSTIKPITAKTAKGVLVADAQADEINSVVEYIQRNTKPSEEIFTFPNQGTFNFLFERPGFGRFYFSDMAFFRPDWRNEFFQGLKTQRPHYAVVKREPDWFETALVNYPIVKSREEVRNFIRQNYNLAVSFGRIDIYKIK